jgi:hypothetical protein
MKRFFLVGFLISGLTACGPQAPTLFGDRSLIVNSPVYRANEVFYLAAPDTEENRWSKMLRLHQVSSDSLEIKDAVQNNDPVSIVVNRVVLPSDLTGSDGSTKDIAVILDIGSLSGATEKSIVV